SSFKGKVTEIADKVMLMSYVHIAHDCRVEKEVVLANCVTLGGHIVVEEKAVIGGITPVHQFARIGKMSIVGGASRIPKDVAPYCLVAGNPAHVHGLNRVGLKRRNYSSQVKGHLKNAYRIIFRSGLNTSHALEKLKKSADCSIPEIKEMVSFIEQSKRGIIK
ncbi:MAG: acyl-ACP--UDP-N-acetylglucosamine O-acyltransferase, partial [Elusimicrobiota bacterium]